MRSGRWPNRPASARDADFNQHDIVSSDWPPETADPSTPSDGPATVQPPALANEADILELVRRELAVAGVAGEGRLVKLLYLAITSRLFERPCSVVVKGPSAGGKSYVVQQVLGLFPPEVYYALSAMSERALAYDDTSLVHRMLVLYEAAGLSGDMASYLMRSLLSEGRISYVTVTKTKQGLGPQRIERAGPTGLITTTTAVRLHPENETRLLSLTVSDSPEQTRAVLLAHAIGPPGERDRERWHAFQSWVAGTGAEVVVAYARPWRRPFLRCQCASVATFRPSSR